MTWSLTRHILCAVFVLAALPSAAAGQTSGLSPYVFGGWSLQSGDSSALNGVTFGGGLHLTDKLSVEGSYGWYQVTSTSWHFSYLFSVSGDKRTTDRDAPLVGALRYSECVRQRVCVDFLGGGGLNSHQISTMALTRCPSSVFPPSCTVLDPPVHEREPDHMEPIAVGGVDVRLRLSRHLSLVPGMRVGHIWRSEYLTGYTHRGPGERSAEIVSFNVIASYRFK